MYLLLVKKRIYLNTFPIKDILFMVNRSKPFFHAQWIQQKKKVKYNKKLSLTTHWMYNYVFNSENKESKDQNPLITT